MVVLLGRRLAMGRYEVTVGEYRAFASATGGTGNQRWRDPGRFPQTDRHPVVNVRWGDAKAYASWLSRRTHATYRLPTEAEWERAATGSRVECHWDRTQPLGTCPVGSGGSNPHGLSDMVGNAWEFTSDCSQGNCNRIVKRGGSFWEEPENLHPGTRGYASDGAAWLANGFRVVRLVD